MRRYIPLLIVLLAVQLGLAGLLAVRRNPLASIPPQSPLIGAAAQSADRLIVEASPSAGGGAARVEIAKRNGQWVLPTYFNAPADKFKVEDLLSELADLKHGLPIATSTAALERFKLADDDFERRLTLSQGAHTLGSVYFGSSAGARRSDARTASDHAVYNVDLATYELPTQLSAWFANDLLESQPNQLSGLDITMPQGSLHLVRRGSPTPSWSATDLPHDRQLDEMKVEALGRTIGALRLQGVLGTSAQPAWQQEHPLLTLTLHQMQHSQNWVLSQPAGASYYVLKASSQPWYFNLDTSTGKQLLDDATPSVLLTDTSAAAKAAAQKAATAKASASSARGRTLIIHHPSRRAGTAAGVAH